MSVQRPTAHSGDSPPPSPSGVMSRQATSCSISVVLREGGGRTGGGRIDVGRTIFHSSGETSD
ncbi:hypothetical protein EYF80_062156 [Liparis tanakae]|uniref:Uncharacterized protein n=1 Tax=Liparis tanakae TaxID=230148 RepID=A0A4Z2EFI7_9TELE|nr:hypothetical protein EYF80_062156 [Liparis tanakae]